MIHVTKACVALFDAIAAAEQAMGKMTDAEAFEYSVLWLRQRGCPALLSEAA